jgi:hypothetical protein
MPISTPPTLVERYAADKEHFQHILAHLLIPAISKAGFDPIPPIAKGSDLIHAEIIKNLEKCDMVLCDMSTLNANVFFELGIRTALNEPVALIKDNFTEHVPFDTGIINHHTYTASFSPWILPQEIEKISAHILSAANRSNGKNNLWNYFGLSAVAEPIDPKKSSVDEKLQQILTLITSRPGLGSVSGESLGLKYDEQVIEFAKKQFSTLNAEIEKHEVKGKEIFLDCSSYIITDGMVKAVTDFGAKLGYNVRIKAQEIADLKLTTAV